MSWLDPFILFFKDGAQQPARRRIALGEGLTIEDDPANDQLIIRAGGGSDAPRVINAPGNSHAVFDGIGSEGVAQLAPMTIVFGHVNGTYHYDFSPDGVAQGWLVFFDLEGSGGTIEIRNPDGLLESGEPNWQTILTLSSESDSVHGIYFDGDDWVPLTIRFS